MSPNKTDTQKEPVKLNQEVKETLTGALNNPMQSMRTLVKGSLFMFMRYFWDTYQQGGFVPNWHIEYLCKELEEVARRVARGERKKYDLIINVPPGTTKTATVSVFFPVWCWVNWHHLRFITTSHNKDLSLESAEYSRDIIRSDKFKHMFPEIELKQDKDVKSNFRVVKKIYRSPGFAPRLIQGGGRVSTSVDSKITGFHAHIIIPDDLIDPKRALSEVSLPDVNQYLDQTLSTRKVDKAVTTMVMIMQRLHPEDPTGHLLKKKKTNIRHICLPGEINTPGARERVQPPELAERYVDGLLDVKRLDQLVLEEMLADLGQYGYAGQVTQDPKKAGAGMFKVERIPVLHHMSSETNVVRRVRYWDKAGSAGKGAYTAGVLMWLMKNGKLIMADVRRGQWDAEDREAVIRATAEADGRGTEIVIEQEPGSGGKESAQATIRNLSGFKVHSDRPTGDKTYRADPFSVQVNNGNVIFLQGDWNQPMKDEMALFPNSTYKDQVDAGSGAFNRLTGKRMVKVGK